MPSLRLRALACTLLVGCVNESSGEGVPRETCEAPASGSLTPEHALFDVEDLDRLTRLPSDPYRALLASSYDRMSVSPSAPGWFANSDASGSQGTFQGERVLLDTEGPGVITRIWSANPKGRLKIYLEGATSPAIDAPFAEVLSQGETLTGTSSNAEVGNAHTLFTAIVFEHRVVVTTTESGSYFAVNYRKYPPGFPLRATLEPGSAQSACIVSAARARNTGTATHAPFLPTTGFELTTEAPHTVTAAEGGSVLTRVRFTGLGALSADAMPTLQVGFDGETTIEGPVDRLLLFDDEGDAVRGHGLRTSPAEGTAEISFPMPFATSATFTLTGAPGTSLRIDVMEEPRPFTDTSLYFHAHWTGPEELDIFVKQDFHVVHIEGRGFYVGTGLRVHNIAPRWWGEGDEKIWVDDDTFPSQFGTGTEDYFGYAWCSTKRFAHASFGQTRANYTNFAGIIELYRFHVADAIPFESGIDFDLEVNHWEQNLCHTSMTYDATSYAYARPGAVVEEVWRAGDSVAFTPLPDGVVETSGTPTTCLVGDYPPSCTP